MARFRFKIIDSQGRRRSGVLRADSLEIAESALRSKLCQIEELTALPGEGDAVELGVLDSSFPQVDKLRKGLAALLVAIFAFSLVNWWRTPARAAPPVEPRSSQQFVVKGEIDTKALGRGFLVDPSQVKVRAVFPELPFEVEGKLSDDGSSFVLPVSVEGVERPRTMLIEVSADGQEWQVPSGIKVSPAGDVVLGPVAIEPAPVSEADKPAFKDEQQNGSPAAAGSPVPERKSPKELKADRRRQMGLHRFRQGRRGRSR